MALPVSREDFEAAWTDDAIRPVQVLHLSMMLGLVMYMGVTGFLVVTESRSLSEDPAEAIAQAEQATLLSVVNVVLSLSTFAVAMVLPRMMVQKQLSGSDRSGREVGFVQAIREMVILRDALLEGPGLYAVTVILLTTTTGALQANPLLWANAVPALVALVVMAVVFPTRDWLRQVYELQIRFRGWPEARG